MKIIMISSLWCPSCIIMKNIINDIEIDIDIYDYDLDKEIVDKYNVGKILPVFIKIDKDNNELCRLVGEKSKKEFLEFVGL